MSKKITGKFVSDPGHSWLSMNLEDFATLGVSLSPSSYINWTRVYAEEDCDATKAINAGVVVGKKELFSHGSSSVRKCRSFSTDLMYEIIRVKDAIARKDQFCKIGDYMVTGTHKRGLYVAKDIMSYPISFASAVNLLGNALREAK
jgi:hypothetical protein